MGIKLVNYLTAPEFTDYAKNNMWEVVMFFTTLLIGVVILIMAMNELRKQSLLKIINEDTLTGLSTEYAFLKECEANIGKKEYELISVDIDNFKYINEVYGYEKGTEVLKIFGKMLEKAYKEGIICRERQDEFLVLIAKEKKDYKKWYNDFEKEVQDILDKNYHIHISEGIYEVIKQKQDIHYIIDCAKKARNSMKNKYGHTSVVFTESMRSAMNMQNQIIASMEKGLDNKEFSVVYQVKIGVQSEKVVGAEALVRWNYKDEKVAHPDDFIRVFERNGFIKRLDMYVLEHVCRFISKSERKIPKISVNLSGITFLSENITRDLVYILNKYNISPKQIELEITESAIVKKLEMVTRRIDELTNLGFYVSMDDFGSGISSINRLKDIKVDELKIDKSFLRNIQGGKEEKGVKILGNVIKMAKDLGLTTVVEGVEFQDQFELLKKLGCTKAQGFYFSKPLSESDFLQRLDDKYKNPTT